ncbi:hypothetical protein FQA39_LY18382 [Lamprigera yunnana]|nr:hypothetical protein FQA39_LY18382 [Lamprigera yunnana]
MLYIDITDNIIAMGYPASSIEGVYRNHIDDVVKFMESKHKDHYFIYNLCSERSYDISKFHNRVQTFSFDDHNPPKIEIIKPFCTNVQEWLSLNPRNVAVVHCKAGKGRTGTMICCYLLHSGKFSTAEEALNFYGQTRTQDHKGVTIPSQLRYVNYYAELIKNNTEYTSVSLYIREIILEPVPAFTGGQGSICFSISQQTLSQNCDRQHCLKLFKSSVYEVKKNAPSVIINLDCCMPITGDIKLEFYSKPKLGRKERIFQFWFNTFFVNQELLESNSNGFVHENGNTTAEVHEKTLILAFKKNELDIVNKKDKQNKVFSSEFKVTLFLHRIPIKNSGPPSWLVTPSREACSMPQDTPSESSEADTSEDDYNDEDDWDSALLLTYLGVAFHAVVERETLDPRGVGYRLLSECDLASQIAPSSNDQHPEMLAVFFRFPLEKDRRDEWLKRCGNITPFDLSFQQLIKKTVCSIHFNEYDFVNSLRNRLVHTAVPIHFNSEQIEKSAGTIEENMSSPTETESPIVRKEVNVKTYGTTSVNVNIEHAFLQYESTITPHLSHLQDVVKHFVNRAMDIHKQVGELRLMSEFDLQWLSPSYLKRNTKSTEIMEAWEKLPLEIRNNEEMKTYLLCTKHWNLPSWECHLDGPPPQKRKVLANSYRRLQCRQFTALAFEADHETVYGLGRWHSEAQYLVMDSIPTSCIQLEKEQIIKYSDPKYNINDLKTGDCETMLLNQTIYYLNKSKSKWISVGLYYPFEFASVVKIFGRSKQYVIFKEEEWIQFHEQRENINKYFQTFDMMWKPRQIDSKTLMFEMIEEKKILKIEDMSGNEVYLGWESVSEVLRYRLSYSSGSNFKYFYEDVIRAVAEMSGDVKINIYNIINRLSEKSDDVCCMLEVLLFMPEKALFDVQLERRIQEQGQKRVKKHLFKKMWMLYAQEHWTKSYDLKSAVERLYEELGALEFDADHEAIYGMERYYTVQQCEELRDKYKIGRKVCRKFLQGKTCSQCLVKRINEIGLRHFLDTVNKYIKDCSDSSSSSDEEVFKAVEQNVEETTEEEE